MLDATHDLPDLRYGAGTVLVRTRTSRVLHFGALISLTSVQRKVGCSVYLFQREDSP
jgi:hypothetical protein